MAYWIEDALIATIIGYVYTIILNEYYKNQGIPTPPMPTLQKDDQYKLDFLKAKNSCIGDNTVKYDSQGNIITNTTGLTNSSNSLFL